MAPSPEALKIPNIVGKKDPSFVERCLHNIGITERPEERTASNRLTVDSSLDESNRDGRREHLV